MEQEMDAWRLNEDILFRRANGKILWQPRIDCWITDKLFADGRLPGPYQGLSKPELYRKLGCSARIYEYNGCFQSVLPSHIKSYEKTDGDSTTHYLETPVGTLSMVTKRTPSSPALLCQKRWVCTKEDLKIMEYIESNRGWVWNEDWYRQTKKEWGRLGEPCIFMPRTSIQSLYIDLMGVEEAVYAIFDYPDTVEAYFKALRESHLRMIDVINASPIQIVNFGDNIHSGTLSPAFFERYVLEEYQIRCERLHRGGKFVYSHFDGNNKGLMEYYQQTGLDGIEAITPLPQGDVTLEEARRYLGDRMFLIDGIPAVYFDETYSMEVLEECVYKCIDLFAPNLILGISDELSSTGDIERIKRVGEIVDAYNARIEAQTAGPA